MTDDTLNIVASSQLIQTDNPAFEDRPGYSLYPREIIETSLSPGLYYARVKIRSQNFGDSDRLRITASGNGIELPRHDPNESLLVPADRPDVIAVGASDTPMSSRSVALNKPDVSIGSLTRLSATEQYLGSSTASAAIAGATALLKELHPDWDRGTLTQALKEQAGSPAPDPSSGPGQGLPLSVLDFAPTGPGCFYKISPNAVNIPDALRPLLAQGGTLVMTTMGPKAFFPFDPIQFFLPMRRIALNDIIGVGPQGVGIFPRTSASNLPFEFFETLETPEGMNICSEAPHG